MKPSCSPTRRHLPLLVLGLFQSTVISAQTVSPAPAEPATTPAPVVQPTTAPQPPKPQNAPAPAGEDDIIQLSPFSVDADDDEGYVANQSLAGTRLNSSLNDIGASVSVLTDEFMRDLGATSFNDVLEYLPSVDTFLDSTSSDITGNAFVTGGETFVIRGGLVSGASRDFFQYGIRPDSFSSERFTVGRGPNSILFGTGSPFGLLTVSSKRALLTKDKNTVTMKTDDLGSVRAEVDFNRVLLPRMLALRFAAVDEDRKDWRKPSGMEQRRYYFAGTFNPFRNTSIRFNHEQGKIDTVPSRPYPIFDSLTPWYNKYGRDRSAWTNYDTGTGLGSFLPGTQAGTKIGKTTAPFPNFPATSADFPIETSGAGVPKTIIALSPAGDASIPNLSWANTARSAALAARTGGLVGVNGARALIDESSYPLRYNLPGTSVNRLEKIRSTSLFIEQKLARDLFLEFGLNKNRTEYFFNQGMVGQNYRLNIDANQVLPNGQPNPNVGRLFVESITTRIETLTMNENKRAMLAYQFDARRTFGRGWLSHLGKHSFGALAEDSHRDTRDNNGVRVHDTSVPLVFNQTTGAFASGPGDFGNRVTYRYYIDPDQGIYTVDRNPFGTIPGPFYGGDTVNYPTPTVAGVITPVYLNGSAGSVSYRRLEAQLFTVQSKFWKDKIVVTYGTRKEKTTNYSGATPRAPNGLFYNAWNRNMSARDRNLQRFDNEDSNWSRGIVFHGLSWLSLFYNESTNTNLAGSGRNVYGEILPNSGGLGKDFGIKFRFFNNKLSGTLSKYINDSTDNLDNGVRQGIHGNFQEQINGIWSTLSTAPGGRSEWASFPFVSGVSTWNDVSTGRTEGYEGQLNYSPTNQLTLVLNGSIRGDSTQADRGRFIKQYIADIVPFWRSNPAWQTIALPDDAKAVGDTIGEAIDELEKIRENFVALSGAKSTNLQRAPKWKANLVARYKFTDGMLKGFNMGTGLKARGKTVAGFGKDSAGVLDPTVIFYKSAWYELNLWCGYKRKIFSNKVNWSLQLNVDNVLDDNRLEPLALTADASNNPVATNYLIGDPRSYRLATTFEF